MGRAGTAPVLLPQLLAPLSGVGLGSCIVPAAGSAPYPRPRIAAGGLGTAAPCVGHSSGEPLLLPANLGRTPGHVCSPRARPRVPRARGDLVPAQSSRRWWWRWQGRARCQPAASIPHVSPRCPRLDFVPAPPWPPPPLRVHEAGRGETQGWGGKCLRWRDAASRDPARSRVGTPRAKPSTPAGRGRALLAPHTSPNPFGGGQGLLWEQEGASSVPGSAPQLAASSPSAWALPGTRMDGGRDRVRDRGCPSRPWLCFVPRGLGEFVTHSGFLSAQSRKGDSRAPGRTQFLPEALSSAQPGPTPWPRSAQGRARRKSRI